jgi:hypothetical protein
MASLFISIVTARFSLDTLVLAMSNKISANVAASAATREAEKFESNAAYEPVVRQRLLGGSFRLQSTIQIILQL